jgi:hypothetical protein
MGAYCHLPANYSRAVGSARLARTINHYRYGKLRSFLDGKASAP